MLEVSNPKWPFIPTCLSDILDKDRLTVIEAGSYDRLGRPLTILDFDSQTGSFSRRIEATNEKRQYEKFCRYFRDETHVKGGDIACKKWDASQAKISLEGISKDRRSVSSLFLSPGSDGYDVCNSVERQTHGNRLFGAILSAKCGEYHQIFEQNSQREQRGYKDRKRRNRKSKNVGKRHCAHAGRCARAPENGSVAYSTNCRV